MAMKSFFDRDQVKNRLGTSTKHTCVSCGLYKNVLSPRMEPFGKFKKKILIIGEAPGETEDRNGKQWQGKVGRRLKRTLSSMGIDLFKDCLNINSINCRPIDEKGRNRKPTDMEIACCRKRVLKVIDQNKPRLILLLGGSAVQSFLGHRWTRGLTAGAKGKADKISVWRGWNIPDRDFHAWVCPTYHPSFVERDNEGIVETIWLKDLRNALKFIKAPFPSFPNERDQVEIIEDLSILSSFENKVKFITFDYECTGLKPHAKGHKILLASVGVAPDKAFAFEMPNTPRARKPFLRLLTNENIGKGAANLKFEHIWSKVKLKTEVQNWVWDTMQAAHIIDNRSGITSLKFQAYVHFGVVDYASEIERYLTSGSANANAFNKLEKYVYEMGRKEEALKYCGLDSLFEYKLALQQMEEIGCESWIE